MAKKRDEGPFLVKLVSGEWVMAMIKRDTVSPTTLYLSHVLQLVERGPKVEFKQWCPLAPLHQTFVINEFGVLTYLVPAPPLVESYNNLVGIVMNPTSPSSSRPSPSGEPVERDEDRGDAGESGDRDKVIPLITK